MNKFYWIHKEFSNPSLNNLSQRLVEFNTAILLNDFEVYYSYEDNDYEFKADVGTILLNQPYTVADVDIINSIMNYNVYFKTNTEPDIVLEKNIENLDCFVSMAAGQVQNKKLINLKRYIIDISPRALEFSKKFLSVPESNFYQVDLFSLKQIEEFLNKVEGNTGLIFISNCFLYIPACILFDINLRIQKANEFLNLLRNDKINWYVNMVTPNGDSLYNVPVSEVQDIKLDERLKILPWIK